MDQHQTKQTKGFDQEAFASILTRIIKKRGIRKKGFRDRSRNPEHKPFQIPDWKIIATAAF